MGETGQPGACSGIRILDLSRGLAGGLATMILADYGAEVMRVDPDERDPSWHDASALLLHRGKKSITLDIFHEAGRDEIKRLAAGYDAVVESLGAGLADEAGLGYDVLSASNRGLVYCSITGFGPSGPFAGVKADDGLVMARAGIFKDQAGWYRTEGRPAFRAARDGSYFAAMLAVQGILAALLARDLTGRGQLVETNMLQALACRQNPNVRWLLRDGEEVTAESRPEPAVANQNSLPHHMDPRQLNLIGLRAQCKDGRWMVHSHTEPHFFPAWLKVLGMDWIWEDERFKGAPHRFSKVEDKDELIRLLVERMAQKTSTEWIQLYLANGNVCGDVIQTTQESLRHPQMVETGKVVVNEDPRVGAIVAVGPLADVPGAPASIGMAPQPGAHTEEIRGTPVDPPDPVPETGRALAGPLDGVTVIECAYYYATPFATSLLADLGARVIKIERLQGDPYRLLGLGPDPIMNLGQNNMVRAMQGKESIALNLKDHRGREILHRLVAKADLFVHSFRPGVPESLGIDYQTLKKVNPGLVYQYSASYGSTGPYRGQPAIDPIIAAFAGTTAYQAGEDNPPLTETGADPVAAAGAAAAMVIGLFARHRTGEGQYVEPAMIVSNIYLNCEDALSYSGKSPRPPVDHLQLGTGATHRLYEAAPPDPDGQVEPWRNPASRWVFFSAEADEEFARFCQVADRADLASDPRFSTTDGRDKNRAALADELEVVFATRTAEAWESCLLQAGVGCAVADAMSHFAYLYKDPQAQANATMVKTSHPSFGGGYWRHAPMVRFSETPGPVRPHCEMGEHTRSILGELGFSQAEMASLHDDQVVAWPLDQAEAPAAAG